MRTATSTAVTPRLFWLLTLPFLAWCGNALYALGAPGGWLKEYSPALVATALTAYVVLHGRRRYGGVLLGRFAIITFAIAWSFETLSILTGFPFGNYHYTEVMAPYLWHVPVFVLPAYALMGYASWSLATVLLNRREVRLDGTAIYAVPLVAAGCMVAWDLSMDPLRATIEGRWIWLDGGVYYGVPLANYFGWFGVTWLMFQCFAFLLRRPNLDEVPSPPGDRAFWISVPLAYSAFAAEYLLNPLVGGGAGSSVMINGVSEPLQRVYLDIALICLMTLIPLAALGIRAGYRREGDHAPPKQAVERIRADSDEDWPF